MKMEITLNGNVFVYKSDNVTDNGNVNGAINSRWLTFHPYDGKAVKYYLNGVKQPALHANRIIYNGAAWRDLYNTQMLPQGPLQIVANPLPNGDLDVKIS